MGLWSLFFFFFFIEIWSEPHEAEHKAVSDKIGKEIPAPFYATAGAAAWTLRLRGRAGGGGPRALVSIPTGIAIALP